MLLVDRNAVDPSRDVEDAFVYSIGCVGNMEQSVNAIIRALGEDSLAGVASSMYHVVHCGWSPCVGYRTGLEVG